MNCETWKRDLLCHAQFETGQLIPDASFVGSSAPTAALRLDVEAVQVRASHFGSFVAVLDADDAVAPETLTVIKSTATAHGNTWIPTHALNEAVYRI